MNRRGFLKAAAGAALWGGARARGQSGRPNIILVLADDLGYGDLGCYGSRLATPNIDRIAGEGALFTDFYAASPVCSPSRAALLTGRYAARTGITGVIQAADRTGLAATETTIAETLKSNGYATACIGKWHLGSLPEFLPTRRGFDEFFGLPYSHDMWPLPLMRGSEVVEEPARAAQLTQRFTEEAVSFIIRQRQSPFFLYLAYTAPHIPLAASPPFRSGTRAGAYGDVMAELDWSVGELLRTLSDYRLEENTMIVFASDNGPWYQGSAGRLKGRKGETFEGGMRVPFLARFPGRIPAGLVRSGMATGMDLLPTLARLGQARLPVNPLDGVDIWPMLSGEREAVERDVFLYFNGWDLQCARWGRWKIHLARYNRRAWNPDPPGGYLNLPLPRPELYDLESDPSESYDCARDNAEVIASFRERIDFALLGLPDQVRAAWRDTLSREVEETPSGALPVRRRT